jgi:hypothetical protein
MNRLFVVAVAFLASSPVGWNAAGFTIQRGSGAASDVLNQARDYVDRLRSLTLTCHEAYKQRLVNRAETTVRESTLEMISEAVFAWAEELSTWLTVRMVRELDRKSMDARPDRLVSALAATGPARSSRLQALADEGVRYMLETPDARLSDAMLTLQVLFPTNRARFQFTTRSDDRIARRAVRRVDFLEREAPTILQDSLGRDVPMRGTVWLDVADGSAVRTNLMLELPSENRDQRVRSSITTNYEPDSRLGTWVPASMQEQHRTSSTTETVNAAIYSNCRLYVPPR